METAQIGNVHIGNQQPLALIGGPCVIESLEHCLALGRAILEISQKVGIPYIFKASFDKANRSSVHSYRGPGLEDGLAILQQVKTELGVPVLSDIHEPAQAEPAGRVLDSIQIPAFLSRQTDLLVAAGLTGKNVNIKKGQFLSPEECRLAVQKVAETGNTNCLLTERGTFFGYNRLVNDMTAMPRMRRFAPVVYDATHSCQLPGGAGDRSGGAREFIEPLALAAIAAGADAIFLEIHDNPAQAKSDPATVLPLEQLKALLTRCKAVFAAVRTR
ncbi:MAG: 3-deoxy-8-phosphooctulonate synthase [Verrucomicrobiota bacterium]|nr:3-deoxy-8-phosphooctulonate synthase [Verrucomicrobiota bacterium]